MGEFRLTIQNLKFEPDITVSRTHPEEIQVYR